jgi:L-asparaginase
MPTAIHDTYLKIYTTGGTIDKIYFDQMSTYEIGPSTVGEILAEANVTLRFDIESVFKKDSLDITEADRRLLFDKIRSDGYRHVIVTHGTDTMTDTAKLLGTLPGRTIVLTGAMAPSRFRTSDAAFNVACAVTAVQILPPGAYVAMNGRVFDPHRIRKNRELNRFEVAG